MKPTLRAYSIDYGMVIPEGLSLDLQFFKYSKARYLSFAPHLTNVCSYPILTVLEYSRCRSLCYRTTMSEIDEIEN